MKNKSQKNLENKISKRFFLLSLLKGAIVSAIGWRFFDLQMIENRKYEKLSDENQFNFHMIAPVRGRILDRKMRLLAGNMDGYSLVLNWNKNTNVESIIKEILSVINIDQKEISIKKYKGDKLLHSSKFSTYWSKVFFTKFKNTSKLSIRESDKETEVATFLHADLKESLYLRIKRQLSYY